MVDKSEFKVQFMKNEQRGGHIEFLFKVTGPGNITFDLRDRYSSMRRFKEQISEALRLRSINGVPSFPPKKTFGNKEPEFLTTRQRGLETFFKYFLAIPEVQKSQQLSNYFLERAADANSTAKVKEMIDHMKKAKQGGNQSQQAPQKKLEEVKGAPTTSGGQGNQLVIGKPTGGQDTQA